MLSIFQSSTPLHSSKKPNLSVNTIRSRGFRNRRRYLHTTQSPRRPPSPPLPRRFDFPLHLCHRLLDFRHHCFHHPESLLRILRLHHHLHYFLLRPQGVSESDLRSFPLSSLSLTLLPCSISFDRR